MSHVDFLKFNIILVPRVGLLLQHVCLCNFLHSGNKSSGQVPHDHLP